MPVRPIHHGRHGEPMPLRLHAFSYVLEPQNEHALASSVAKHVSHPSTTARCYTIASVGSKDLLG
ncbi:hypothetical protein APY04_2211 [Hyphomicrobium sulfonivorans]|uniref:Uncharacterized protein n=1 Tax=Hyphomicrobium sulfonivorans TaxID=121290 RepID=A0A109BDU9_HYPSL|nr:hypothetical protein APY04_2211 [Hyphomicrobium sulfonivorans]